MSIEWRSKIDIGEEQRLGHQHVPPRVTRIDTLHCEYCKGEIVVLYFEDKTRSVQPDGVREVLGKGSYHAHCPDLREDDLRHDADVERTARHWGVRDGHQTD